MQTVTLLLTCVLASSLLACKKTDSPPTPAPLDTATVEAKWTVDSLWETHGTAPTRYNLRDHHSYPVYWEFTKTEFLNYSSANVLVSRQPYSLANHVLSLGPTVPDQFTIAYLSAHRLVLVCIPGIVPLDPDFHLTTVLHR